MQGLQQIWLFVDQAGQLADRLGSRSIALPKCEEEINLKHKLTLAALGLFFGLAGQAYSQSSGSPTSSAPPSSIVGKYLVYDSGAVTTFYRRKLPFGLTQTIERYEYSPSGNQGAAARLSYNSRNGTIEVEDLMPQDMIAALHKKNRIYRSCAGDIFKPPVRYRIEPARHSSGNGRSERVWKVRQDTYTCKIINVQHNARDYSCRSSCVEFNTQRDSALDNMLLYSSKEQALAEARRRVS